MRFTILLCLLAGPAWADACHDWWFTRNLVIDRAGYCFGSVLGQAQFDNTGCIGKTVSLDPASTAAVNQIRGLEADYQCRVDTSQPVLNLPDRDLRLQLLALPIADGLESACIGYRATPLALRAAPSANAPVIGQITPGDTISYAHLPANGWSYVTTYTDTRAFRSGGWFADVVAEGDCDLWAG
ncbi:DUF4453 domain-containing protein [uncultured Tateyamaria sp.]|uniref:DUF4453 domain-containing protein n=1 Tax=Tateyamaria sp. 1078 TaxID=3417464 RepID=UPI00261CAD25|nr:DUF4453 domain-containing protein [uncultured Tateyamaria sp.]